MDDNRRKALAAIMGEMKGVVPPGYRLTLVARNTRPDGDKHVMITEDEPDRVCAAIQEISMMVLLTGGTGKTPEMPPSGAIQ